MKKADFRSMRRRIMRSVNRAHKAIRAGNKRGLPYLDTDKIRHEIRNMRLKACKNLVA